MTTDDALRRDLIAVSRRRAIYDRNRLSHGYSIGIPLAFGAAGLLFAWAALGRRPRFALAALAVAACAWLALHQREKGREVASVDEDHAGGDSAPQALPIDEASLQSFPASDPPAVHRSHRV